MAKPKVKRKQWNEMDKAEKTMGLIGLAVIIFIIMIIISAVVSSAKNTDTGKPKQTITEPKEAPKSTPQRKEQPKPAPKAISQSDAEDVCQDANFLQNYVSLKDTSIVTLSYKPYFTDMGDGIKSLQWNGKNKNTDSSILFVCDVSKDGDKIVVKKLAIDAAVVYEQ